MSSVSQIVRRHRKRIERKRALDARRAAWSLTAGGLLLVFGALPLALLLATTLFFYTRAAQSLPTPESSQARAPIAGVTELYDRSGQTLIYAVQDPLGDRRRIITLDTLPPYVAAATLQMEDPDYLTAAVFNPLATVARMWNHIIFEPAPPDPSLTGRLVRNAILPQVERFSTDDRLREIILVAELNRRYAPEQLLEWHLNTNYYGNEAYGIEAAAQIYLGKSAVDLTLDEAALLASIPTAPQYNPFDNETAARGRQQDLLRALRDGGAISDEAYDQAASVVTAVRPASGFIPQTAPEYALYARRQAEDILDRQGRDGAQLVARGGLRITTALDLDLYEQAACTLDVHLRRLQGAAARRGRDRPSHL